MLAPILLKNERREFIQKSMGRNASFVIGHFVAVIRL